MHGKDIKSHTQNHCSWPHVKLSLQFPITCLSHKQGQGRKPSPPVFSTLINGRHHQPSISNQHFYLPGLCPSLPAHPTLSWVAFSLRARPFTLPSLLHVYPGPGCHPSDSLLTAYSHPHWILKAGRVVKSNPIRHKCAVQNMSTLCLKLKTSSLSTTFI